LRATLGHDSAEAGEGAFDTQCTIFLGDGFAHDYLPLSG